MVIYSHENFLLCFRPRRFRVWAREETASWSHWLFSAVAICPDKRAQTQGGEVLFLNRLASRQTHRMVFVTLLLLSAIWIEPALAQSGGTVNSSDVAWVMICTGLVFLMTPGLAFFYGGFVRSKNILATLMHSVVALAVVSLVWFAVAFSLAFAPSGSAWIGGAQWMLLSGVTSAPNADYGSTIPLNLFMIFQCMFAIITAAIISGAYAERVKFSSHVLFLILWTVFVYAPVAHWVWGTGGFFKVQGVLDFGGGLVIHIASGASAVAAALVFGPRKDYGSSIAPGRISYVVLGTALLWFGWFGFNGGSALAANEVAATALINTHMAAAAAMVSWILLDWMVRGKPSVVGACVGCLLGMIALSPACGFVSTQSAVAIGAVSGIAGNIVANIRAKSRIDDSLDVFACHGVGGFVGTLATGLLASKAINPGGADGNAALFLLQLEAAVAVLVYCFVGTFVILKLLAFTVGLRPTEQDESVGLDLTEHGESSPAST